MIAQCRIQTVYSLQLKISAKLTAQELDFVSDVAKNSSGRKQAHHTSPEHQVKPSHQFIYFKGDFPRGATQFSLQQR